MSFYDIFLHFYVTDGSCGNVVGYLVHAPTESHDYPYRKPLNCMRFSKTGTARNGLENFFYKFPKNYKIPLALKECYE